MRKQCKCNKSENESMCAEGVRVSEIKFESKAESEGVKTKEQQVG